MMFPKSKLGGFFVLMYLLLLILAMLEYATKPPQPMQEIGMMVLTLPWSFIIGGVLVSVGMESIDHTFIFYALVFVSWVINAALLYLLVYFVGKISEKWNSHP